MLKRLRALLATLWLGLVAALALLVTPTAFAVLERAQAGRLAGALFRAEAHLALAWALALFLIERGLAARQAATGRGSRVSVNLLLILAALFCTVLGYFGLQPMMEAARRGTGPYSFGLLHGASAAFFALKALLLAVLAWRVCASA
ncbi:MAG: DUF4149 domain-containing protein [Burkholderiales bacterium]